MTARGLATLVHTVRRLGEAGANISDAELLGRFSRQRDETAFAALVGRHGPMVLGVCHRVLRDLQAAEDAFQATFLVLAGKARTLRRPEALGSFLHGVAYRTALRARTDAVKRRLHESRAVTSVAVEPDDDPAWRELRLLLDGAIDRLPEVYRVPFVLCYLQDKTNAEAARQLGCSRGTIATRLARARKILRTRLARLAPEFSPALFAGPALPNALRPLMLRTARMVVALTAGSPSQGVVSPHVVALVKGVRRAMLLTKVTTRAAVLLAAVLITSGAGFYVFAESNKGKSEPEVAKTTDFTLRVPSGKPSAALLVAYLNDNARRVQTLTGRLFIDLRIDRQAIGLDGRMAWRKPGELRVKCRVAGNEAVDLGSNEAECWLLCSKSDPASIFRAPRKDLAAKGKAPLPFDPDWIAEALGIAEYDPDKPREVVVLPDAVELVEKATSPQGKALRKVVVFNPTPDKVQVKGYRIEDDDGNVLGRVTVQETQLDKASGAVVARKLRLEWVESKADIRLEFVEIKVNEKIDAKRAAMLFAPPPAEK
jgi:RNA polymerase sigma factor (sigma-70 family)